MEFVTIPVYLVKVRVIGLSDNVYFICMKGENILFLVAGRCI